jgi:threonine dehydrogenase-like Zn-dependent dehydrogenase
VLIRVHHAGVCGTDLHIWEWDSWASNRLKPPVVIGHEFAGEIVAVGPKVSGWSVGDQVAVDPSLHCGECYYCRRARGNLCENWAAIGDTVNGAFAEYVAVPAVNAYRLPANVDGQHGAMAEPLACAVHGLRRIGPVLDDAVVVIGAGTMGLLLLRLLVHSGAGHVAVVDRVAARLDVARKFGAAQAVTDAAGRQSAPPRFRRRAPVELENRNRTSRRVPRRAAPRPWQRSCQL